METKHCPKCDSENLGYGINIFKEREERYTGEVSCNECNFEFNKKDVKIRYWKEIKK